MTLNGFLYALVSFKWAEVFKICCSSVMEPNITKAQSVDFKCDYPDNQEEDVG